MDILFDDELNYDDTDIEELRRRILKEVMAMYTTIRELPLDPCDKTRPCKRCTDIAVIVRRGSDDVVKKVSQCMATADDVSDIDSFIKKTLPDVTVNEPSDMSTIDHMNMVLDVITDRYKTYVATGELDQLLDKLTLKELSNTSLTVLLRSIIFVDEVMMFCDAPNAIGEKFIHDGIKMIAKIGAPVQSETGAPVQFKTKIDNITDDINDKEDVE